MACGLVSPGGLRGERPLGRAVLAIALRLVLRGYAGAPIVGREFVVDSARPTGAVGGKTQAALIGEISAKLVESRSEH